ncbi:MAG: hypothetical protein I8H91_02730 [Burkholderiales bacterium]|nr:hypothetical protein [Burkholderiales bacterium]
MQIQTISATALEKLKRLAKQRRDSTGQSLNQSLEAIAQEAGYASWKQVTVRASNHLPILWPAQHNSRLYWVDVDGSPRMRKCETVEELCNALGGVEPIFLRYPCHHSHPDARCLCALDPFVTAKHANVGIDIGDKHDFWNYLFITSRPYRGIDIVNVRINLGLGSHGFYLNEHLLLQSNADRSNSLNPNNAAYDHSVNNRSNQLNPNNYSFRTVRGEDR